MSQKGFALITVLLLQLASAKLWSAEPKKAPIKKGTPVELPTEVIRPARTPVAEGLNQANRKANEKIPANKDVIQMISGTQFDLPLPPMPRVIEFKGDFEPLTSATYIKSINAIRFLPKKDGVGVLTVHDSKGKKLAEYNLAVSKNKFEVIIRELQSKIGDIEGITIGVMNNKVVVDGQVLLAKDISRITNVINQYTGEQGSDVVSLVTVSPLASKKIAELIEKEINNPEIRVRTVNEKYILEGWANSDEERKNADTIAKLYMPPRVGDPAVLSGAIFPVAGANSVVNLISIKAAPSAPPPKIVQLVVHYVELNKDYNKSFRFQFSPGLADGSGISFQTGGAGTGAGMILAGTIDSLFPKLNWAKEHGFARVLQSSSVLTQENVAGTLSSYTDYPYVTAQPNNAQPTTSFQKVGLESTITPTILGERSDTIALDVQFSVSAPAGTSPSGQLLISTNAVNSKVSVRSGQSAAIGGLISNKSNTQFNKLPSDFPRNPIISLYASKGFSRQQTQFVVFVTPIIKSSASQGSDKIKRKFRLAN